MQPQALNSPAEPVYPPVATPLTTGRRGPVAKRRFQKGCFVTEAGGYYSIYYSDAQSPDGATTSKRVRQFLGSVNQISERAARREHDRIMQDVNRRRGSVASAYRGQTFADAVRLWRKQDAAGYVFPTSGSKTLSLALCKRPTFHSLLVSKPRKSSTRQKSRTKLFSALRGTRV